MEKDVPSRLFVNDGSFMEKFKQLQQGKQEKAAVDDSKSSIAHGSAAPLKPFTLSNKKPLVSEANDVKKDGSGGKLAFSLKQKSKVLPVIKLGADEDDDEGITEEFDEGQRKRQKLGHTKVSEPTSNKRIVAPSPPSDPAVRNVADKLASFVAKSGRHFEDITRQKNPGDTPFRFLFDTSCSDYKYYEHRLLEEEKVLAVSKDSHASAGSSSTSGSRVQSGSQRNSHRQQSKYQIPASALYESSEDSRLIKAPVQAAVGGKTPVDDASVEVVPTDPIAMMEFYMKKAAQEERKRQPRHSKDEMPPPASLQASAKKGHHMGDYIPDEELVKFLSTCNDAAAQKAAKEAAEKAKIQADNVGHKLLSKMGWKEGEGLGSSKSGRADPVMAGNVKLNNLGVGAEQPGEVTPEDDIYEQYKKRMMLGYRYRPNPLNNPRKAYY